MRRLSLFVIACILCSPLQAQYANPYPAGSYENDINTIVENATPKVSDFKPTQLVVPGVLITSGIVIHCFAHETIDYNIREWSQNEWRAGAPEQGFDNIIQYIPLAMDLGLGLTGINSEHCFIDRAIESAIGHAVLGVLSGGMKEVIESPRPNRVDTRSFPSGHTDFSFINAELVRMEYGWGWGAGAYAIATTVGIMRIYNDWHWASDVIFGAGLGILCAHVGGWLLEPTKRILKLDLPEKWQFGVVPVIDPFSKSYGTALALRF
ncbi:MAG: phosphatase PAP2 family protein [Bacteroidales bacterium]|nr:phosphatase PAP2 family protein [Bacteroidales bacterium]